MQHRVLIIHDESDKYLGSLLDRCGDCAVEVCASAADEEVARRFEPQIVFSWKCAAIPPAVQRSIIDGPAVEWVHIAGAGFEHLLPLPSHLIVTNSSGVCSEFMAETVLAAILMWNFGFPHLIAQQHRHEWEPACWVPLREKTALILGLGRIGAAVARYAKVFGMRVLAVRNKPGRAVDVDVVYPSSALHEVLPQADYVCVHLPLTGATAGLIGTREFGLMKPGAILINTSRGGVVDEDAMADALLNDGIAGAYCDVFETEPLPEGSPLWDLRHLIISPHMSDTVVGWERRLAAFFADNLDRWRRGQPLRNAVDSQRGY